MQRSMTLGELVTRNPAAARVLERARLDYCCGGRRTLEEAARAQGLDPEALLAELAGAGDPPRSEVRWSELTVAELCDELVIRYHLPLRAELPSLVALARKVESVHAGKAACPVGLSAHLESLAAALLDHLAMEEQSLFPAVASGPAEWLYTTAASLEQEHEDVGAQLRRTRELTGDLTPPAEACASWRELYRRLGVLEHELFSHVHLENNVLFPRILSR